MYGELVYKFKTLIEKPTFTDKFKMIIKHLKKSGNNMGIILVCMHVCSPITFPQ